MSERSNNFLGRKRENETKTKTRKHKIKKEETNESGSISIEIPYEGKEEEEEDDDKNVKDEYEEEGGENFRKNDIHDTHHKGERKNDINEKIRNLFEVRIKKMRVEAKKLLKRMFIFIFVISWIITVVSGLLEAKVRLRYVVLMVTMLFFLRMCD